MHARPPFPPGGPRRPPFHPRFMLHGPRRPPPPGPPHGPPHMGPRGVMGPRFRRGLGPWGPPPPRHDMIERDMRRPPAPHEVLAGEPAGPLEYEEEIDREPGWAHPRGRGLRRPPMPPHEMVIRRPPMRPPMSRERWRGPPRNEEEIYEETRMVQRMIRTEVQLMSIKIMNKTMSITVLVRNGAGSNFTETIHQVTLQITLERNIG